MGDEALCICFIAYRAYMKGEDELSGEGIVLFFNPYHWASIIACLLDPPTIQYFQSHETHMDGIPAFNVCIWSWLLALQCKANGQRDSIQENTENGIDGNTERTDLL